MSNKSDFEKYPNYQLFRKNTMEKAELDKSTGKSTKIQAQQVVTEKCCSQVIEFTLPFPAKYPALELMESATLIKGMTCNILKDIVLISGYVHKRISYVCFEGCFSIREKSMCYESTIGNIKVLGSDIPFSCSVEVQDIQPKDKIEIVYAGADPADTIDILENPVIGAQDRVNQFRNLNEKLIIFIKLRVLRPIQTQL